MARKPAADLSYLDGEQINQSTNEQTIEALRSKVREARDTLLIIEDLSNKTKEANERLAMLERKELPDMLANAGVDSITLAPEGNLPGYTAKLSTYLRANIAASWPEDQRQQAFDILSELGGEQLIKNTFTIEIDPSDAKAAHRLVSWLDKQKSMTYERAMAVPWGRLTAFLKELIDANTPPSPDQIKALGGDQGMVVKLKKGKSDGSQEGSSKENRSSTRAKPRGRASR